MPNWITNRLTLTFESFKDASEAKAALATGDNDFDFNNVIRMPEDSEDFIASGNLSSEDMKKDNWYDWSIENWGTKWNSSDACSFVYGNVLIVHFQTAWDTISRKMLDGIVSKFKCGLSLSWYDENIGYNCGNIRHDGKSYEYNIPETFDEGMDFIADEFIDAIEGYQKVDGHWKYVEE